MSYYRRQELTDEIMSTTEAECSNVLKLWHDKKTARGAANTTDGKAEKVQEGSDSVSIVH